MPTPHKHAKLIKAYADGAEIEVYQQDYHGDWYWQYISNPVWMPSSEYRIKPTKPMFRVALYSLITESPFLSVCRKGTNEGEWEKDPQFIRWVTDWIEYDDTICGKDCKRK